jgi:CheY-like chemotaxis protein
MVYGIVQQSGGHVWIDSAPGEGTTVRVYLPRVNAAAPDATVDATPDASTLNGHETILMVEDDELVRQISVLTLERQGYHVLFARDGAEALTRAQEYKGPIHLLIADVIMPRMSGQELAAALRTAFPQMRVLYISGYADQGFARRGVVDPDAFFLQKPFIATALAAKVREVLGPRPVPTPVDTHTHRRR